LRTNSDADVNNQDVNGQTALMCASARGRLEEVNLLLENSADVNNKDMGDNTALKYALKNGYMEVVELLTKYIAKK
jgi:ankyrin repeat protein